MASLSLPILTPPAFERLQPVRPARRGGGASESETNPDLVISTILLILMAAAGLYGEILSHL